MFGDSRLIDKRIVTELYLMLNHKIKLIVKECLIMLKYFKLPTNKSKNDTKYIEEAVKYVEKHFPKNYGTCDNFQLPISHSVN